MDPTSYALIPLFTDSSIPSALKSICWSLSASALYLFASGAGEMLLVLRVEVSSARESEMGVRVNVQPWVQAEAITSPEEEKEKGQVRVMDMGVRSFPVSDDQDERHLVLTGWSDGKLRVSLLHSVKPDSARGQTNSPVAKRCTSLTLSAAPSFSLQSQKTMASAF